MEKMKAFTCADKRSGFWLTFPSGITISCQWDYGNYADNHEDAITKMCAGERQFTSDTIEIMIWDKGETTITRYFTNEDDDVKGYVTLEEFLSILDKIRSIEEFKARR